MKNPLLSLPSADRIWLEATFARNRARFGDFRMEADPAPDPAPVGEDPKPAEGGEKPFADLSADEKVEFLLAKTRRLEDAAKGKSADPESRNLRKRVKELEAYETQIKDLEEASRSEAEKAVRKAQEDGVKLGRDAALAEARKTYGSQLAGVRLDAAAAAKGMSAEQMRKAAGDLTRFLDDEGVDDGALTDFLSALPDKAAGSGQIPLTPGAFGAGRRETAKTTGIQAGEDLFHKNHPKKSPASA